MVRLQIKKANRNLHVVTRVSYPFLLEIKLLSQVSKLTRKMGWKELSAGVTTNDKQYTLDQRVAASFILYPKPFGVRRNTILVKGLVTIN
jgi:hypothetical protein